MHFTTPKLQRLLIRNQHRLRQDASIPSVNDYVARGRSSLQYQRDLNSLVQSAPLSDDERRAEILAKVVLRAEALRHHARDEQDESLAEEANRLIHRIVTFAKRRTENTWRLVELTAEKIKHFHAEIRDAFEHEMAQIQDGRFLAFEDFLAKHRSASDYAELINFHLEAAEHSDDPDHILHELAWAMLQMESMRRYAHDHHLGRFEEIMLELEKRILDFVDTGEARSWNTLVERMKELRANLAKTA